MVEPRVSSRARPIVALMLSLAVGCAIWVLWEPIFGIREAWDGERANLYPLVLAAAGIGVGYAVPGRPFLVLLGGWVGQLVGLALVSPIGPFTPLGAALLLPYTLLLVLGAALGGWLRGRWRGGRDDARHAT